MAAAIPSQVLMNEPAKLLLLASLLAQDRIITNNNKAVLKELILQKDERLFHLLKQFEATDAEDRSFLSNINRLIEEYSTNLYNALFAECSLEDGKYLSKSERERNKLHENKSLIYGEVEFRSFSRVLRKINPAPGGVFYDLGSGTSKAVFVARFTQDFSKCVGVEILKSLHDAGMEVVDRYNKYFKEYLHSNQPQDVELINGDVLTTYWSDGDVVFANSTCFEDDFIDEISDKAATLKPGAYFITFTKGLTSQEFEVLSKKRYKMSWGPATVFIHRRLNLDGSKYREEGEGNGFQSSWDDNDEESDFEDDMQQQDDDEEEEEEEEEEEKGEEGGRINVQYINEEGDFSEGVEHTAEEIMTVEVQGEGQDMKEERLVESPE